MTPTVINRLGWIGVGVGISASLIGHFGKKNWLFYTGIALGLAGATMIFIGDYQQKKALALTATK
jgi:hypothetical protein